MGTAYREGGSLTRDEVRAPAGVAKVNTKEKGTRHTTVGETVNFDKTGFPRGANPSGAGMDDDSATFERGGGV